MLERPTPPLPVLARLLLGAAALLLMWAALLIVTGGVDIRPAGIRLSSRDPFRPGGLAFALLLVYAMRFQAHAAARATSMLAFLDRHAPRLAVGLALITLGTGLTYATFVAGGSDAYGYVSQSKLWLAGHLIQPQPFTAQIPWPLADWTFAPLGYRDAPGGGAIVPIYAPGLPMLMALMTLVSGDCGPYLVVPLLGALTVWLTYQLGRLLASRTLGLAAAVLMASSPTFLFMLMPPMSDVPMTTFVLAAVVLLFAPLRARAGWAGAALGGALLVRPNLVPLVPCFGLFVLLRAADWRTGLRDGALFTIGLLPGVAAVAAIHTHFYGAPWRSGYGPMETLYGWRHLIPNLQRYPIWLLDTQTPLVLAAILPLAFPRRTEAPLRSALLFFAALIAIVWLCYLFYLPFEA